MASHGDRYLLTGCRNSGRPSTPDTFLRLLTMPEEGEEGDGSAAELVPICTLPEGHTAASFTKQAVPKISRLAVKYKNDRTGNPRIDAEIQGYLTFLKTFLPWLETDARMTTAVRDQSKIDKALKILFDPIYNCPEDIATQARRIYLKFEDEQWGIENHPDSDPDDSSPLISPSSETPTLTGRPVSAGGAIALNDMYTLARPPPDSHPIWGLRGIMHGFIIQPGIRRFNYVLDPRCQAEKRSCKVFGHNGLEPGAWWPFQKVALFHGAHGHSMGGISGHADQGAWSIVVSGRSKYQELDRDLGATLWYSSDQSHDNVNPLRIEYRSNMSLSLHTSISTGKPVRVLRSSGKGAFAPSCGIRYDGLYRVIKVVERKNTQGGLFEQFKLSRQPDQAPLEEICKSSPTRRQCADFERVKEGY